MKNMMKLLTGVFLLSTLLIGCSKDDGDKTESENYFKIGDNIYELSAGILGDSGADPYDNESYYGYETNVILYSEGLSLQQEEEFKYLVGIGDIISFSMFSTNGDVLDNDVYEFTTTRPYPIGTINESDYGINHDKENRTSNFAEDIVSGTVSVSKSGNEYSITFNCTSESGKVITGSYKGTLSYIDYTNY